MSYSAISRGAVSHDILIWIKARDRSTGLPETMGLWTGSENLSFTIDGEVRTYQGAGQLLNIPPIKSRIGLTVQMQTVGLAAVSPEVETAIRLYDSRLAPVEIHVARFDPETNALLGVDRVYKGSIDKAPITTPAKNGNNGGVSLSLASGARALTRRLTTKRSDESQRRRSDDRFFRFADVAGKVERFWGTQRVSASAGNGSAISAWWGGD